MPKITKKYLQRVIQEEITKATKEQPEVPQLMSDEEIEAEMELTCRPWSEYSKDPRCQALWKEYQSRQ